MSITNTIRVNPENLKNICGKFKVFKVVTKKGINTTKSVNLIVVSP